MLVDDTQRGCCLSFVFNLIVWSHLWSTLTDDGRIRQWQIAVRVFGSWRSRQPCIRGGQSCFWVLRFSWTAIVLPPCGYETRRWGSSPRCSQVQTVTGWSLVSVVPVVLEISKVHIEFVESAPCCELLFHFFFLNFFCCCCSPGSAVVVPSPHKPGPVWPRHYR